MPAKNYAASSPATSTRRHTSAGVLCLLGLLAALLIVSKEVMNFLPNIEPVTLLLIVYTLVLGLRSLSIVYVFVLVEGLLFGFGQWWFSYLYIWTLLVLVVWLLRGMHSRIGWALVAGVYGLLFGALCALVPLVLYGPATGLAYWIAGIPYDLLHCAGNFILTLLLCQPLYKLLNMLYRRWFAGN